MRQLILDGNQLRPNDLWAVAFRRGAVEFSLDSATRGRINASHLALMQLLENKIPVYGVTTGFGDSGSRLISFHQSEELQKNLVSYLLCGSGPTLSPEVSRAILTIRLNSLSRGLSGVSVELIERMQLHLQNDWLPLIPREGSLGASGDLIPLAYLADNVQGQGRVLCEGRERDMSEVLRESGVEPYRLKAKEGLALVNGTSAMAGQFAVNLNHARFLLNGLCLNTAWLCLALGGRTEAFEPLVNEQAKRSRGQGAVARLVRRHLEAEGYSSKPLKDIRIEDERTQEWVQDRYSLRCIPQIAGPIEETLALLEHWLEDEINSSSDNPLVGGDSQIANGGNFYGGYLSQGMDYLKISLAHMADVIDRQIIYVIDEKSNRGLPANLAGSNQLDPSERHLHHGLKGLHQSASAITSEIMARATPGGIFSRSSESHNQDKVSLGMSAAVQCADLIEPLFTLYTLQSVILAQALDLRGVDLQGSESRRAYQLIRSHVPFVKHDQPLGERIKSLREAFVQQSREGRYDDNQT
jgi:histidine ammonia-lyase/phenylalanine ammonia-lyase